MKKRQRGRPERRPSQSNKKKSTRTPRQQKKREQQIMISLLIVIAVLIGFVIALLPEPNRADDLVQFADDSPGLAAPTDGAERRTPDIEPSEQQPDSPRTEDGSTRDERPNDGEAGPTGTGERPTETYPDDERPVEADPSRRDRALWWLPETVADPSEWGTLYLVLDDAGRSLSQLQAFLELPFRMAVAVLPLREYSIESALEIAASGNEVLLHQPMEPLGTADPGPGALFVGMSAPEVRSTLLANLESVPGAVGVNNHMGSRATGDAALMRDVLSTLDGRGLFFLDSRTSAKSVARTVATRLSVPFAERRVFLDNVRERDAILESMRLALERVHNGESVVMIGHVTAPELADTLREIHFVLAERGYYFGLISNAVSVPRIAEEPE